MKKMLVLFLLVLFLTGCGKNEVPVWAETQTPRRTYSIMIGVPDDAGEVLHTEAKRLYRHEGGEYEISTTVFTAEDVEQAVRSLTGKRAGRISLSKHQRFDLPEFRFSWVCEENNEICKADMVIDGENCYAVTVSLDAEVEEKYDTLVTEVFSTFGLFYDEGV